MAKRDLRTGREARLFGTATLLALLAAGAFPGPWAFAQPVEEGVDRIAQPVADDNDATSVAAEQDAVGDQGPSEQASEDAQAAAVDSFTGGGAMPSELLHVPITGVYPGDIKVSPPIENPSNDAAAVERGMQYFNQMNCIGCHAPNGAGGMGPALSNATFIYGGEPANIYLSILQGRPAGMPVYGGLLPDQVIWDLVAYIQSISKEPMGPWGKTTSVDGFTIEQVPAEYLQTTNPWDYTQPFSYGQAPYEKVEGSPPLETPEDGEAPK